MSSNTPKRIMFAGPSGYGKTLLSRWLSDETNIGWISGSVSDLVPSTKDMPHKDMLSRDEKDLYKEDYQILNLRNKLFKDKESYITDRSYIDSAAYFMYKQADKIPACEIEQFFSYCNMLLCQQCDLLIMLHFVPSMINKWVTEDNGKRITNNFFQVEISYLMRYVLDYFGFKGIKEYEYTKYGKHWWSQFIHPEFIRYGFEHGEITSVYGNTQVLVINEPSLAVRKDILKSYVI